MTTPETSARGRIDEEIVAALDASSESCAAVARTLGFSRQNLHIRAKTSPAIRRAIERLNARAAALAVSSVRDALNSSTTLQEAATKIGVGVEHARRTAKQHGLHAEMAALRRRQLASARRVSDDQIVEAVEKHGGINRAARALGMEPSNLCRRMRGDPDLTARIAAHRRTGRA